MKNKDETLPKPLRACWVRIKPYSNTLIIGAPHEIIPREMYNSNASELVPNA